MRRLLRRYSAQLAAGYVSLIVGVTLLGGLGLYVGVRDVYVGLLAQNLARTARVVAGELQPGDSAPRLSSLASQVGALTGARVTLIAHDGTVLADTESDPASMESHASRPEVRKAMLGGTGFAVRRSETLGRDMLYVAVPAKGGLVARLAVPTDAMGAAVGRLRLVTLIPLLAASVLGLVGAMRSTAKMTGPLRDMSEVARDMAAGRLTVRAPVDGPLETAELGASLNLLASNLESRLAELASERGRLETLLGGLPAGVVEVDRAYRIVRINSAAERLLRAKGRAGAQGQVGAQGQAGAESRAGADGQVVLGRHYSGLVRSYSLSDAVVGALEHGRAGQVEARIGSDPDDLVHVTVAPLRDPSGGVFGAVLVFEDLGPTRRDARVRRELVANVSHELKTPVAAIAALAETLTGAAASDPVTARRFAGHILRESERLGRLIGDLLELARLEARETPLDCRIVDLMVPVEAAAERFRPLMGRKGLEFATEFGGSGLWVLGDEHYLERAVTSLLDNALKFTPPGGRVQLSAVSRTNPQGLREVEVGVSDSGSGLKPEETERVFERFYRADPGRSRAPRDLSDAAGEPPSGAAGDAASGAPGAGIGLGLAIVKHIILGHGGTVGVESAGPGLGCRFWFRLPLASR